MLNQIKTQPKAAAHQSAAELLLACHDRIRHFSGVAVKLAHGHGATEPEIASAADSLYRYFSVALPLHEADENLSLHPRLRRAVPEGELAGPAADAMLDQHMAIDELVERLIPLWLLLKSAPGRLPELSAEMCSLSKRLNELFDAHLKLEEDTIFPVLSRYLSEAELGEIVDEMQARRKTA